MFPINWQTGRVGRVVWRPNTAHHASYSIIYNHIGSVRVCVEVDWIMTQNAEDNKAVNYLYDINAELLPGTRNDLVHSQSQEACKIFNVSRECCIEVIG